MVKVEMPKKQLLSALKVGKRVAEFLNRRMVVFQNDKLHLWDSQFAAVVQITDGGTDGSAAFDTAVLFKVVSEYAGESVSIIETPESTQTCPIFFIGDYQINGIDTSESFPCGFFEHWADFHPDVTVPSEDINRVLMPAQKNDFRPHLNGVFFGRGTDMVTTNGYALYVKSGYEFPFEGLVPAQPLRILNGYAKDIEFMADMHDDTDSIMYVKAGDLYGKFTMYDPAFPKYTEILKSKDDPDYQRIVVSKKALPDLHKKVLAIGTKGVPSCFKINGTISVQHLNSETGKFQKIDMPVKSGAVTPHLNIMLNTALLSDAAGRLSGDDITMSFNGRNKVVFLTGSDTMTCGVMPFKSSEPEPVTEPETE